jgi:hypothetical protein
MVEEEEAVVVVVVVVVVTEMKLPLLDVVTK